MDQLVDRIASLETAVVVLEKRKRSVEFRLRIWQVMVLIALVALVVPPVSALASHDGNAEDGHPGLAQRVDTLEAKVAKLQTALEAEKSARVNGDAHALAGANTYTDSKVAAEASARQAGDNAIAADLNGEVTRAKQSEAILANSLGLEENRAKSTEISLQTEIQQIVAFLATL